VTDASYERPTEVIEVVPAARLARARHALRSALASYRLRIVGWFIALLAIGTLATVVVVGQLLYQRIDDGIRQDLVRETEEFRALATGNDPATGQPFGADVRRMFDVFLERNIPTRNEVFVTFVEGEVHGRSPTPVRHELERDEEFLARTAAATEVTSGRVASPVGAVDYIALPVRVDGQTLGVLAVANFRDVERAEQQDILLAAGIVGLILLVIGSILAWRLADRLLAPVLQTAATARAISETDLSQRVDVGGYDEVAELARTFNEMLDRLAAAFGDQRRFLDDVGHELRTPLTIVRGHLELMEEGTAEERDRTRELVLDELDRMTRLVNDLMVLAQSSRPDFLRRESVDSAALVHSVHEKASVLADRSWRVEVGAGAEVVCDPQRITQAMLQLATNAVSHTRSGDEVRLGADVDDGEARFWVGDSGPGIAAEEQAEIFRRFYRSAGQPRASGRGLGLSIVQAIAEAHGGEVDVTSQPGHGARFTIVIPRGGRAL
jgi:two-component system, OmpR family, sensor kinase